jgi:hypothetical protein
LPAKKIPLFEGAMRPGKTGSGHSAEAGGWGVGGRVARARGSGSTADFDDATRQVLARLVRRGGARAKARTPCPSPK